jgi:hypothetical protein
MLPRDSTAVGHDQATFDVLGVLRLEVDRDWVLRSVRMFAAGIDAKLRQNCLRASGLSPGIMRFTASSRTRSGNFEARILPASCS